MTDKPKSIAGVMQDLEWAESDAREIKENAAQLEERVRNAREFLQENIIDLPAPDPDPIPDPDPDPDPDPEPDPEPPTDTGYTLHLDVGGQSIVFRMDDAEDMGVYDGEHVKVRAYRATHGFWSCFFWQDTDGSRIQFVLELGGVTHNQSEPFNAGPWTATLRHEGQTFLSESKDYFRWNARCTAATSERPQVRSREEVLAHPLIPRLNGAMHDNPYSIERRPYSGPMSCSAIFDWMPGGGRRGDIGLIPEHAARYLVGDDSYYQDTIDFAKGHASVRVHIRDENGMPQGIYRDHPSWHYTMHPNEFGKPNFVATAGEIGGRDHVTPETPHYPAAALVAYLLTDDPYYLEEMQFQVVWHYIFMDWPRRGVYDTKGTMAFMEQYRGLAWCLRDVAYAAYCTPENAPSFLLPKSYFQGILDDYEGVFKTIMDGTAEHSRRDANIRQLRSVFRYPVDPAGKAGVQFWQHEYFMCVAGQLLLAGFEQFREFYEWALHSTIQRTNGQSGWDKRWCITYNIGTGSNTIGASEAKWSEGWDKFVSLHGSERGVDVNRPEDYYLNGDDYYLDLINCSLAIALQLGYDVADEKAFTAYSRVKKREQGMNTDAQWCID